MARLDDVTDDILQATIVKDVPRWDGRIDLAALDTPEQSALQLQPTPSFLQSLKNDVDEPPTATPPETGQPAAPDGDDEDSNYNAIEQAALHRLQQRIGSALWQPTIGIDLRQVYGQPTPPDDVTDICARAVRPDADWYRIVDASWRYAPRRRDWIVVTLTSTDESNPAPIFVNLEVA